MQLSSLVGLWLLAFTIPLLLLYVLKTRRVRTQVGSTWLWQQAARDLKARTPFRRLRWLLPLVLQLLVIAILALAATRPFSASGELLAEHNAIIIDVSASMQAVDSAGVSRLNEAKALARRLIEQRARNGEVMLISAGSSVQVVSPFERDRVHLLRQLETIHAEDAEGSLSSALELAAGRLRRSNGKRKILVLTDGALADRTPLSVADTELEIVKVGKEVDNVGIVHVDVRAETPERAPEDTQLAPELDVSTFARVHNFTNATKNMFVTLRQRNVAEPLASRNVRLAPNEEAAVVLSFSATAADLGSGLIVELDPKDALGADDRAFTLVPEARLQTVVLLAQDPSPWLERALLADPEVSVLKADNEAEMAGAGANGALLVFSGLCPQKLPGSHFLIINPPAGDCLTTRIGPKVEFPKITSWRETDPRLRFLSLAEVHIQAARTIEVETELDALLRTQNGVVMAQLELQGRIGTVLGFDFGDSDWPLKASFVLFIRNLVEQAREHRLGRSKSNLRAGTPPILTVPLDVQRVQVNTSLGLGNDVTTEGEGGVSYDAKMGLALLPPLLRAGFHQVSWQGTTPGSALLAVSLVSEKESDLRERPLPEAIGSPRPALANAASSLTDWSWLLALAALLLLLAEVSYSMRNRSTKTTAVTLSSKVPWRT